MRYAVEYPGDEETLLFVDSCGDFFSFKEAKENLLFLIDEEIWRLTEYRKSIASMRRSVIVQ